MPWKTELKDCQVTKIIHLSKDIDLVHSLSLDPKFRGWRIWDYEKRKISENEFGSSNEAIKSLMNGKVIWGKLGTSNNPQKCHSITQLSPIK